MPYKDPKKQKEAQAEHYQKHKALYGERCNKRKRDLQKWFQELKTKLKCAECEENHPACLEFHHTDPTTKEYNIGIMAMSGCKEEKVLAEIAKCIVLCSNCHKKLHYNKKRKSK